MFSRKNQATKGFTIIEVLIVLAIAGLILLIVFLAVPALQRNSRNTQRRDEVATIMASVNEYVANNGKLPVVWDSTDVEFQNAAGDANGTGVEPKLSFYTAANLSFATSVPGTLPSADADKVYVYSTAKCSGNSPTGTGASSRQFVGYYFVESSTGTPTAQCVES